MRTRQAIFMSKVRNPKMVLGMCWGVHAWLLAIPCQASCATSNFLLLLNVFQAYLFEAVLSFLGDFSYKRKLLDKHNTWVLKIAPVLFLLYKITLPLKLEINHLFD